MAKNVSLSLAAIKRRRLAIGVLFIGAFGLAGAVQAGQVRQQVPHQEGEHLKPTGKGWGEHDTSGLTKKNAFRFYRFSNNGISYHGGPVMLNTVNVYYIWYGAWANNDPNFSVTQTLLNAFGSNIGAAPSGTPYFNINTTYNNSSSQYVSGQVRLPASATDAGSQGSALTDTAVGKIVATAMSTGGLPTDPNGVYFVLTSKEVTETSGFCTQYCAWHTHGTINGQDIKYGFIGNPMQCPSACSAQTTTPNNDLAADGMVNLIAHELAESVTDPDLNAWYDSRGYENADKCAWNFGAVKIAPNGSYYNVTFGSYSWLLQQNWINASGGYCTLSK